MKRNACRWYLFNMGLLWSLQVELVRWRRYETGGNARMNCAKETSGPVEVHPPDWNLFLEITVIRYEEAVMNN
jgi:hypothetical protein